MWGQDGFGVPPNFNQSSPIAHIGVSDGISLLLLQSRSGVSDSAHL